MNTSESRPRLHVCRPAQENVDWTCAGCDLHMPKLHDLRLSRAEIQVVINALAADFHATIKTDVNRAESISRVLDIAVTLADDIDEGSAS